MALKSWEFS